VKLAAGLLFVLLPIVACKPVPPPPPVTIFVKVIDEAKAPVESAEIASAAQIITTTNAEGRAEITVSGREGATFLVDVRCPQGYRSPEAPLEVRRLDNGSATAPEYVTKCNRLRHKLVVNLSVKAPAGANVSGLPVLYLGKPLTKTDAEGKAKVALEGDVFERVDLTVDTNDASFAKYHPQNPVGTFEIPNGDDETAFEVKFTVDKPPPKRAAAGRVIKQI
jgi:hypothetical protein